MNLSPADAQAVTEAIATQVTDANFALPVADYEEHQTNLRLAMRASNMAVAKTASPTPRMESAVTRIQNLYAQATIDHEEALRAVGLQNTTSQEEATMLGQGHVRRELEAVVDYGNADQLQAVLATAGVEMKAVARQLINNALANERAEAKRVPGSPGTPNQAIPRAAPLFPCPQGAGDLSGYGELKDGASVTLSDAAGKTIGLGQLFGGTMGLQGLTFDFTIDNVPESLYYGVEVANRGVARFTKAAMLANKFNVKLTVG